MDTKAVESANSVVLTANTLPLPSGSHDKPVSSAPAPVAQDHAVEKDSVTLSDAAKQALEQASKSPKPDTSNDGAKESKTDDSSVKDFERRLSITDSKQVVVKIIDPQTNSVVDQIPSKEQVRLREAIGNLVDSFTASKGKDKILL